MEEIIEIKTWGGNGGTSWDDGKHNGVREIQLIYGHCIDSILVVYDKNNTPVKGEKHGGSGGSNYTEVFFMNIRCFFSPFSLYLSTLGGSAFQVKLQYPDEYLVSVSGNYCTMVKGGTPVIRSLTFKTNKKTYGPFGMELGTPFCFQLEGHHIVGFKGRSGWYLDAISFHISRVPSNNLLRRLNKTFKRLTSIATRAKGGHECC
ncbi:hypothetical protein SAY87_006612 [Trapa incisa]|uniref:Jacalin-type lectin domain-containing protein n=1 Tax=Trapa incisa TaxID=236973 RepID=A0AAN7Q473_9MYRT|nr:hypothetical protein SAY87_006612 [Trapa incisa]